MLKIMTITSSIGILAFAAITPFIAAYAAELFDMSLHGME